MNSCFYNLGYSGDSDKTLFERIFYYMFFKIPLKIWLVYLMMSFYLGYLIFKYYHFKKMIKIEWIVWIFIFCNIFLMLMSKTVDFNRLIMPVLPLVLILLSQTFYLIIFNAKLLIKKCFFD